MTTFTTPDNLPYPDDYQQPADSPSSLQALAAATQTGLTARAYAHLLTYMAELLPAGIHWSIGDRQMTTHSWDVGTLAPGEEKQVAIAFTPGTFFFLTVQHSSTYIYAVVQDLGNGNGYIKVRNGTAATPHSNVKVHVLLINPPAA